MTASVLPAEYYHNIIISQNIIQEHITNSECSEYDSQLMFGKFLEASKAASDALIPLEALLAAIKLQELVRATHPDSHAFYYSTLIFNSIYDFIDPNATEEWMFADTDDWINDQNLSPLLFETQESSDMKNTIGGKA